MATSGNGDGTPAEGTVELRQFVGTIAQRRWLVVGVTLVAIVLAAIYTYSRTPIYVSQADVLVNPLFSDPVDSSQGENVNLQTEMRIATSAPVANQVKRLLGISTDVGTLLRNVSVAAPDEANILEISYTAQAPGVARDIAQAFAESYLEFRSTQGTRQIAERVESFTDRIDIIDSDIDEIDANIEEAGAGTADADELAQERDLLEAQKLTLEQQRAAILGLVVDPGQILQPAGLPTRPSQPNHPLDLLLGALVGVALGVVLASAIDRLRDRVDGPESLEHLLEAPVLGLIPKMLRRQRRLTSPVTVEEPRSHVAEAFRMLRTNVLAHVARPSLRTILVTSAWPGEGKTTVACNLAAALAHVGQDVILISADLRFPRAHSYLGVDDDRGLTQLLTSEATLEEALQQSSVPHLRVLTSGPLSEKHEPAELIQSERMWKTISECAGDSLVIIDGAPVLPVADGLIVATMVDAVLMVADARGTRRATVARAAYQLRQVGAVIIGGVLNAVEGWTRTHSGYAGHRRGLLSRAVVPEPKPEPSGGNGDRPAPAPTPSPTTASTTAPIQPPPPPSSMTERKGPSAS